MRKICAITAVSEETPNNFHISNGLILSQSGKNKRITSDFSSNRFLNSLKRNNIYDKPYFNYSDIRQQAFDLHSLKPSKALDVSNGVSPKLRSLTPFHQGYSKCLDSGFGKRRGQFTVESSQSKVNRIGLKELQFLSKKKFKVHKNEVSVERKVKNMDLSFLSSKKSESDLRSKGMNKSVTPTKDYLKQLDEFEDNLLKYAALKSQSRLPTQKRFYEF